MRLRAFDVLCDTANQDEAGLASIQPWVGALSACSKQLHVFQKSQGRGRHGGLQTVLVLALVCGLVELVFELVELACDLQNLEAAKGWP